MSDTPDRLAEIAARLAAATPGPWTFDALLGDKIDQSNGNTLHIALASEADMYLIAHAPDDIGWLVERVKQLEDNVEKYRARAYLLYVAAKNAGVISVLDPTRD